MEVGIVTPNEVCEDFDVAWLQRLLGREAIRQAKFPQREEGYGLASAVHTGGVSCLGEGKPLY